MKSYGALTVQGFGSVKVTPSDLIIFNPPSRGLWIGTPGKISVTFPDGTAAVDMPTTEGYFPFFVIQVNQGTAATDIWTIV